MKILITGGAGFIGSHLVNDLVNDHELIVVDNLDTGKVSNFNKPEKLKFYQKDIRDFDFIRNILSEEKVDCIIHLAAVASVFKCVEEPFKSSEVNYRASLFLLDEAVKYRVKQFIFASSAAVFGDEPSLPKTEDSKVQPISGYGIDKYAIEQYVLDYARRGKILGTAFRFFNVFGPNQDPGSPYSGVLSIFTDRILKKNSEDLHVYGDGLQSRDFIYVKDLVQGIKLSLTEQSMNKNVFNLGTGIQTNLLEVIDIIEKYTGKKINIHFEKERLGDIKQSLASIEKIQAKGFSPQYSFAEGMKEYFDNLEK